MIEEELRDLVADLSRVKIFEKLKFHYGSENLQHLLHDVYVNVIHFWFRAYGECNRSGERYSQGFHNLIFIV